MSTDDEIRKNIGPISPSLAIPCIRFSGFEKAQTRSFLISQGESPEEVVNLSRRRKTVTQFGINGRIDCQTPGLI